MEIKLILKWMTNMEIKLILNKWKKNGDKILKLWDILCHSEASLTTKSEIVQKTVLASLGKKKWFNQGFACTQKNEHHFLEYLSELQKKTYYFCFCLFFCLIVLRNDTMWGSMFLILQCIAYIVDHRKHTSFKMVY